MKVSELVIKSVCPFVAWGEWGNYGDCSVTCGPGERTRSRVCQNRIPDELECEGLSEQTEVKITQLITLQ